MKRLALLLPLLAAGCDLPARKAKATNETANEAALPPMPAADSCADGWTVRLDEESFRPANLPSQKLDEFVLEAARSAAASANRACREFLDPAKARRVSELVLAEAPGETGAPLFRISEDGKTIRVEWSFAQHRLAIPSEVEWRAGLSCAIDANAQGCGGDGPGEKGA